MIRLTAAEKLEIQTSVAGSLDWEVSIDTISSTDSVPSPNGGNINAATTTDIVPAGTELRQVRLLTARNRGASNSVVIKKDNAGNERHLFAATLEVSESIQYSSNTGWQVFDAAGRMKVTGAGKVTLPPVVSVKNSVNKGSLVSQVIGSLASMFTSTGYIGAGAIPTTAAVCNNTLAGAWPLASRSGTQKRLLTGMSLTMQNIGSTCFVEDRLLHMGGLNGTLTTAQAVNLDITVATNNLQNRVGASDYSEVEWFLDWYAATGATTATPTLQVTYMDLTTSSANIWVAGSPTLPASVSAGRRYKIIPAAGKIIKSIQSCTLSASTGTAGNFGVTASRMIELVVSDASAKIADKRIDVSSAVEIRDEACLVMSQLCAGTSTGTVVGYLNQTVVN